jgi:hypothetical protein
MDISNKNEVSLIVVLAPAAEIKERLLFPSGDHLKLIGGVAYFDELGKDVLLVLSVI